MGIWEYKNFLIISLAVGLLSSGFIGMSQFVFADNDNKPEKGRTTSLEALGILQVAAHDLYHFDRSLGIESEDGKLNLSTLLEIKIDGCTAFVDCDSFSEEEIRNGGEARNSDSILIFTVASELGEKYFELVDKLGSEKLAYEKILEIYHKKVKYAFQQTFNQPFPDPQVGSLDNNHNLALRSGHDFLPGMVKFNGEQVSVFDSILVGEKFSKSELKQRSSPLDGQFDDLWNRCIADEFPPSCTEDEDAIPLLFLDQTFGFAHTDNEFTFDEFMEETSDGRYDSNDKVTQLIIEQFARGINLT